jgi:hypothetical protein
MYTTSEKTVYLLVSPLPRYVCEYNLQIELAGKDMNL